MVNFVKDQRRMLVRSILLAAALLAAGALPVLTAAPAEAACTRLAFSVTDFGKDGPARDAQQLLDKHIKEHMSQRGISNYRIGKKEVTCELYLNLIVFDEYTCRAEAPVCWD